MRADLEMNVDRNIRRNVMGDKLTTIAGALLAGLIAVQGEIPADQQGWVRVALAFGVAVLGALARR